MIETILGVLSSVGLGHPFGRAVFGVSAGFLFQYFFRPSLSYLPDGTERPLWFEDENVGTYVPWFAWPIGFGALFGLFI